MGAGLLPFKRFTRLHLALVTCVLIGFMLSFGGFTAFYGIPRPQPGAASSSGKTATVISTVTVTVSVAMPTPSLVVADVDPTEAAGNSTLGFGEIVYLSMPSRTDRQDAIHILAAYSDVSLKMLPGVDGNTMSRKARPDNTPSNVRASELGCWRAHADAWRYMLGTGHETMLILEDDVDWDLSVKEIFGNLSTQLRSNPLRIDEQTEREVSSAPYGLDWDILVFGQCRDGVNKVRPDLVFAYDDPHVPGRDNIGPKILPQLESHLKKEEIGKKRIVSVSYEPMCTQGYAITRTGATRLLLELSYLGLGAAVDIAMINRFKDGKIKGYTITPPIFNGWRVDAAKDTDNQIGRYYTSVNGRGNKDGYSLNIKNSARRKMVEDYALDNWDRYNKLKPPVSPKKTAPPKQQKAQGN